MEINSNAYSITAFGGNTSEPQVWIKTSTPHGAAKLALALAASYPFTAVSDGKGWRLVIGSRKPTRARLAHIIATRANPKFA